ncbi:MAG: 3-dehydroquinate synthase [Verrucomicrobiia bacterium]
MRVIERQIRVCFHHQVHFTRGVFERSNPLLKRVLMDGDSGRLHRVLVVVDEGLAQSQTDLTERIGAYFAASPGELKLACPAVVIPGGEFAKNSFSHVTQLHAQIDRHHLDRHSVLLAVGGGALLDLAGLAAATAHRGIRHVRLPTTTLSQNDSGVGVKNGINAFGKKNFVGTFAPPFAVINDFEFLSSLSPRDKRAGYVEAVKVALIRDAAFFESLERQAERLRAFEASAMEQLIYRCAELHVNHIATSGDPFEFGSARPLDFGHWAAHKIEQVSGFRLRHGEAVAIGIAIDVLYSRLIGWIDAPTAERILSLLERLGFELFAFELLQTNSDGSPVVLQGLEEFREHLGGELTVTLLQGIGRGVEAHEIKPDLVRRAIDELQQRSERWEHLREAHRCH